jgi:hypothetical protein
MRVAIFFTLVLSVILSSCGEQEAVVVPDNYKGYIVVIFNQKNGDPIKYEGKKRVYEIPQDGILKTQFEPNDGWRESSEFYYEKIAPENKLLSFAELKEVPEDTIVGLMGGIGTMKKNDYNEDRFVYALFYIGTKSDIEQSQEQVEKVDFLKQAE